MASKTPAAPQANGNSQVVEQLSRKRKTADLLVEDARKMFKDFEKIVSRNTNRSLRMAPKPTVRYVVAPPNPKKRAVPMNREEEK